MGEGFVLMTHVEDVGRSHIGCVSPTSDPLVDVDPETVDIPDNASSQHVRDNSTNNPLSPKSASYMRHGDAGKSNARKRTLTDTIFLANAINSFVEGTANVEQHKMQSAERMTQLLIDSNEHKTLRLAEIETEFRRETRGTQMAIANLFATMIANKALCTSE